MKDNYWESVEIRVDKEEGMGRSDDCKEEMKVGNLRSVEMRDWWCQDTQDYDVEYVIGMMRNLGKTTVGVLGVIPMSVILDYC